MKKKAKKVAHKPRTRTKPAAVPEPAKKRQHKFFVFCANSGELERGFCSTYGDAMAQAVACLQSRANHRFLILEEVNAVFGASVTVAEEKV